MIIKVYINSSKIKELDEGAPVLVKQMPLSQYDVELFIDTKKFRVTNQSNGILLIKKKWYEIIFRR